jgi:hypothetical protein
MSINAADFDAFMARSADERRAIAATKRERIRLLWRMRRGIYPVISTEFDPPLCYRAGRWYTA